MRGMRARGGWRTGLVLLLAGGLLPAQDAEAQFKKQCMSCHTVGAGAKVGPDLKGVGTRRSKEWALKFMQGPDTVLDSGDPVAAQLLKEANGVKMPNLGLTPQEADGLFNLIETLTASGRVLGGGGITRPVTAADIQRGRELFEGRVRFAKGGPACLSCHTASGAGFAGKAGGKLGPDLTTAGARLGKGLASAIETPAFPTMQGVFAQQTLTPEEAFQVAAFIASVSGDVPGGRDVLIPVLALAGVVGGLGAASSWGRNRFRGVRKNLEPKA